jgi:hypothetical protein
MAKKKGNLFGSIGKLATETQKIEEQIKKLAQEKVKPVLKEAFGELKAIVPTLEAIKWQQFTPHFNDGDTCEFSLQCTYFKFTGVTNEDSEDGDGYVDSYSTGDLDLTKVQQEALDEFEVELSGIEVLLKDAFGDHAEVYLDSEGIEVEEYSHD